MTLILIANSKQGPLISLQYLMPKYLKNLCQGTWVFPCMGVLHTNALLRARLPQRPEETATLGLQMALSDHVGCWALNLGTLEEQLSVELCIYRSSPCP